jgi:HSP20 family protein
MLPNDNRELKWPNFTGIFDGDILDTATKELRDFFDLFEGFDTKKKAESEIKYNTYSVDNKFTIHFHVPGLKRDDINIGIIEDVLTVEIQKNFKYNMFNEKSLPSAKVSLKIKDHINIDTLSAKLDAGILTIEFIKKPVPVKPEKKIIEIK